MIKDYVIKDYLIKDYLIKDYLNKDYLNKNCMVECAACAAPSHCAFRFEYIVPTRRTRIGYHA
jgi:hypothetical protein